MCAQFLIRAHYKTLGIKYLVEIPEDIELDDRILEARITPHTSTWVVVAEGTGAHWHRNLRSMKFSLLPSWSKESKVKFATHNARIETLTEKPVWRGPLTQKRCLIPLSEFIEPIYHNELAGNMVRFFPKNGELLTAAGLWDQWVDKTNGEIIESFAIITTEAPEFVARVGHDRCPVFLKDESFEAWLDPSHNKSSELLKILHQQQKVLDLDVSIDRPLKAGWEKRVSP